LIKELSDLRDNIFLLLGTQFGKYGKCESLRRRPLRFRKVAGSIAYVLKTLLQVQRYGIIDIGTDTRLG
jgi:hypothetical protein